MDLLKTGSAFQAPSAAVAQMVDAILLDKQQILPCSAYLQGEFGIQDLFVGVPVKLGARGMEQVVEIELGEAERAALANTANSVRALVQKMGL